MQLATKQKDGVTVREHLQRLFVNTGKVDALLVDLPVPPPVAALWDAFCSLQRSRRSGMSHQPLAPVDVQAWCALNRVRLTPWEYETLIVLDGVCLRAWAEQQERLQ